MADTPKKPIQSPTKKSNNQTPHFNPKKLKFPSLVSLTPQTPQSQDPPPRRSSRRLLLKLDSVTTPEKPISPIEKPTKDSLKSPLEVLTETPQKSRADSKTQRNSCKNESIKTPKRERDGEYSKPPKSRSKLVENEVTCSPVSPDQLETKKRKRGEEKVREVVTRAVALKNNAKSDKKSDKTKKRVYYKKVVYDGREFEVGDDVYVKRREDASSDDEEPEMEECRVCFKAGKMIMIECDDCLGGFHLKCLKPPLKEVPEGDWICGFCEARKFGKVVELPRPPEGKKQSRTLREKLLSSDLWAAYIERFGVYNAFVLLLLLA